MINFITETMMSSKLVASDKTLRKLGETEMTILCGEVIILLDLLHLNVSVTSRKFGRVGQTIAQLAIQTFLF